MPLEPPVRLRRTKKQTESGIRAYGADLRKDLERSMTPFSYLAIDDLDTNVERVLFRASFTAS